MSTVRTHVPEPAPALTTADEGIQVPPGAAGASRRWRLVPRSLKARLLLGAGSVAFAILVVVLLTTTITARRVAREEARRQASEVTNYFAAAVAESLAARDRLQVEVLSRAFVDNGIDRLLVLDPQGRRVYASDTTLEALAVELDASGAETDIVSGPGGPVLHARRSVQFGDAPVGQVHIWLDRSRLEDAVLQANKPIYVLVALGFAAVLALLFYQLHSPFRALRKLCAVAQRIGRGDLSERVPVHGNDQVAQFCEIFNQMADGLQQSRRETLQKHLETIRVMINSVEAKDDYTAGHCLRVGGFSRRIADRYENLTPAEIFGIETAALIHDIGKIGIPDAVLLKEGKLTDDERVLIEHHVVLGEEILSRLESMRNISKSVRHHHERWDGSGYPDGLHGLEIPFASRVISVADALDAMLTDRPYRKALTCAEAIATLEAGRGTQFDPEVVDVAISLLESECNVDATDRLDLVDRPDGPGLDLELELERVQLA